MADNNWNRLSVRRGTNKEDGPYEGMPGHLMHPAGEWLRARFGWFSSGGMNDALMGNVASSIRLTVKKSYNAGGISDQIFQAIEADGELFLDCLDATLHHAGSYSAKRGRPSFNAPYRWICLDGEQGG